MHGRFIFSQNDKDGILIPESVQKIRNTIVDEGEDEFLKMIMRADLSTIAAGGNWYLGLCNQVPAETDVLADIVTEPTFTNGYARSIITRDATGFPTLDRVNGVGVIRSTVEVFTASGGPFSAAISRAFLSDVASGAGILFAYSGALTTAITLADTESINVQYELFLD